MRIPAIDAEPTASLDRCKRRASNTETAMSNNVCIDDGNVGQLGLKRKAACQPDYPPGTLITKEFGEQGWFDGTVYAYDNEELWYKIKYADGDEEEMDLNELEQCINDYKLQKAREANAPEAPGEAAATSIAVPNEHDRKEQDDNVQVPFKWSQLSFGPSKLEDFVRSHVLTELDSIKMTRRMEHSIHDPLPPRTSWEDDLTFGYTITTTDCSGGQRPVVMCQTLLTDTSRLKNLKRPEHIAAVHKQSMKPC